VETGPVRTSKKKCWRVAPQEIKMSKKGTERGRGGKRSSEREAIGLGRGEKAEKEKTLVKGVENELHAWGGGGWR